MKWIIVGLGNPGGEYAVTRHNTGRIVLDAFHHAHHFPEWKLKNTYNALTSVGDIADSKILLLEPETYMNESGKSLVTLVKSKKQAMQLVVIHDEMDMPLGTWKISWNRNSGGHNGVESISTTLKTKEFIRVRVGIASVSENGIMKKPKGDEAVIKFVLGKFRDTESLILKKVSKEISNALPVLFSKGLGTAMNQFN